MNSNEEYYRFDECSLLMNQVLDNVNLENTLRKEKVSQSTLQTLKAKAEQEVTSIPVAKFIEELNHQTDTNICIVDVRSESEYASGHIPGSFSLPLLSDQERHIVGKSFSLNGYGAAMGSGMRFVRNKLDDLSDKLKLLTKDISTVSTLIDIEAGNMKTVTPPRRVRPKIGVYCFRGRMRSRCISWWFQQVCFNN